MTRYVEVVWRSGEGRIVESKTGETARFIRANKNCDWIPMVRVLAPEETMTVPYGAGLNGSLTITGKAGR